MLKIDIAKAFDSLSWEFLIRLLHLRGFGIKWTNWLSILLSSATTKVLVNGDLTDQLTKITFFLTHIYEDIF